MSAGIDHAFSDAVAIMDADLQDPPDVLLAMLGKWGEGFEVVYGVRRRLYFEKANPAEPV